jgi:hypothetical protein
MFIPESNHVMFYCIRKYIQRIWELGFISRFSFLNFISRRKYKKNYFIKIISHLGIVFRLHKHFIDFFQKKVLTVRVNCHFLHVFCKLNLGELKFYFNTYTLRITLLGAFGVNVLLGRVEFDTKDDLIRPSREDFRPSLALVERGTIGDSWCP